MMQEDYTDYYEEAVESNEYGCCLVCEEAEEGCLCRTCKCKKCYWYSSNYDDLGSRIEDIERDGVCDLARRYKSYSEKYKVRTVYKATDKAIFCSITNVNGTYWIPQSAVDGMRIKNWILIKKGIVKRRESGGEKL